MVGDTGLGFTGAHLQRLRGQALTAVEAAVASSKNRFEDGGSTRAATDRGLKISRHKC